VWHCLLITGTGLEFVSIFAKSTTPYCTRRCSSHLPSGLRHRGLRPDPVCVCGWEERRFRGIVAPAQESARHFRRRVPVFRSAVPGFQIRTCAFRDVARFLLFDGACTRRFCVGPACHCGILPLALLMRSQVSRASLAAACVLVVLAGWRKCMSPSSAARPIRKFYFREWSNRAVSSTAKSIRTRRACRRCSSALRHRARRGDHRRGAARARAIAERLTRRPGRRPDAASVSAEERHMHGSCFPLRANLRARPRSHWPGGGIVAARPRRANIQEGPDYIDPMWALAAAGRTCRNLDFNLSRPSSCRSSLRAMAPAPTCVWSKATRACTTASTSTAGTACALAQLLDLPVVLVLDARGMTRASRR